MSDRKKPIPRKVISEDGTVDIDASMKQFEEQPDAGFLEDVVRAVGSGTILTIHLADDSPLAKMLAELDDGALE